MSSGTVADDPRVARNAAWLGIGRVTSAATTLGLLAIIARTGGPEALGAAGVGFALGAIAAVVSDLGVSNLLVRDGARDPSSLPAMLGSALVARAITGPMAVALIAPLAVIAAPGYAEIAILAAAGLVLQQVAELSLSVFVALQRMRVAAVAAVAAVAENLAWLAVAGGIVAITGDIAAGLVGGLVVFGLSTVAGLALDAWLAGVRPHVAGPQQLLAFARLAAPFAAGATVAVVAARIDTVLIATLLPAEGLTAAGIFFASSRLVGALEYVPEVVGRAAYPELARRFVTDPVGANQLLRKLVRGLLLAAAPWPALLWLGGGGILLALFGSAEGPYAWLVPALALALPARFLAPLFGLALAGSDQVWRRFRIVLAGLAALVAIDLALIPTAGVIGAVVGAIAGPTFVVLLYGAAVRRAYGDLEEARAIGYAVGWVGVAAVPAVILWWAGSGVLAGVAFGVVYLALTWRTAAALLRGARPMGAAA